MSQRGRGTGHLYEKHGSYYGRWRTLDGRNLNRIIGPVRTPGTSDGLTRAQAERFFRRLQDAEERAPRPVRGAIVPSVDEVCDSLRQKLRLRGARRSYLEGCESMQRVHISPWLGAKPVSEIRTAHIEALASSMLDAGLAPKTVRSVLTFLHSIFEHALQRRLIHENPVRHATRPGRRRGGDVNPDLQFLTVDELDAVIRAIPDDVVVRTSAPTRRGRPGPAPPPPPDVLGPVLRVLILAAAITGLRQSELLGLRWRDVDWTAQRIRVRNTFVRGEHSSDGKSELSTRRSVPMADRLARELDGWSRRTVYCGEDDLVFAHPQTGNPLDRSKVTKALQGRLPDGGRASRALPRSPPHLRHAARRDRTADPLDPGVPRPRRCQDHPDLHPLRALRARGRDGQRGLLAGRHGERNGEQTERNQAQPKSRKPCK
jgi:integrase